MPRGPCARPTPARCWAPAARWRSAAWAPSGLGGADGRADAIVGRRCPPQPSTGSGPTGESTGVPSKAKIVRRASSSSVVASCSAPASRQARDDPAGHAPAGDVRRGERVRHVLERIVGAVAVRAAVGRDVALVAVRPDVHELAVGARAARRRPPRRRSPPPRSARRWRRCRRRRAGSRRRTRSGGRRSSTTRRAARPSARVRAHHPEPRRSIDARPRLRLGRPAPRGCSWKVSNSRLREASVIVGDPDADAARARALASAPRIASAIPSAVSSKMRGSKASPPSTAVAGCSRPARSGRWTSGCGWPRSSAARP